MTGKHINPGTDTTINPVVIDDSFRSKQDQKVITAWAIKAPDGKIFRSTIAGSKEDSIKKWERSTMLARYNLEQKGYRCVRVNITEVSE